MSSNYDDPNTWRLQTVGGIPYRIVSQEGSFGEEEADATVEYLVVARQLLAFVLEVLPAPTLFGEKLVYLGGSSLPGLGVANLRCSTVKWKAHVGGKPVDPFSADLTAATGTYDGVCTVTVNYKTQKDDDENNDESPETFLEISAAATGDFLNTTAAGGIQWQEGETGDFALMQAAKANKNPDIPIIITVPQIEWTVKWPRIPWSQFRGLYINRLRRCLGRVNSDPFNLLFAAPAGTMLFLGWDYSESYTWRSGKKGQPPVNLSLKFLEKNVAAADGSIKGHNHFWKPGEGWVELKMNKANTLPPYQSFNFDSIFFSAVQPGEVFVVVNRV